LRAGAYGDVDVDVIALMVTLLRPVGSTA